MFDHIVMQMRKTNREKGYCVTTVISGARVNVVFTITAEILARSICGQTHEFEIRATRQRARAGNSTICYRKNQIDVSFSCVCPVIDNEFRHHIVKVVCGSNPRGDPQPTSFPGSSPSRPQERERGGKERTLGTRLIHSYFDNVMTKFSYGGP